MQKRKLKKLCSKSEQIFLALYYAERLDYHEMAYVFDIGLFEICMMHQILLRRLRRAQREDNRKRHPEIS